MIYDTQDVAIWVFEPHHFPITGNMDITFKLSLRHNVCSKKTPLTLRALTSLSKSFTTQVRAVAWIDFISFSTFSLRLEKPLKVFGEQSLSLRVQTKK